MSFKPKNLNQNGNNENSDKKPFVVIEPEDGLQAVQIGLLVNLGLHKKLPKFAKDSAGKREQDDEGKDKIIVPKEGKDIEQKVAVYVDLLDQTHDYEGAIGVKNIRLPLHQINRGLSDGLNLTTVAPRDPNGNYIKGKPWLLAPASAWAKIAAVTKMDDGKKVSEVIFDANYKNPKLNDISQLLGKKFMYNVEVKVTEKDGNKYVNTKLKSPVPLMKGMNPSDALVPAISINFDDDDILEPKDELGGACKYDFIRVADLRKIVLAEDYEGSKMQEAIREREDEDELIKKAKEIRDAVIANDKELQECLAELERRGGTAAAANESAAPAKEAAPAKKVSAPKKPVPVNDSMDDDIPFAPVFVRKHWSAI